MTLSAGNANTVPTTALRSATNELHRQVEQSIDWKARLSDASSYEELLRTLHYFLAPTDRILEAFFGQTENWIQSRRTAQWARSDWYELVLRRTGNQREAAEALADFDRHTADELYTWVEQASQAAGLFYVLEGSTMGSVHLCKIVTTSLGPEDQVPVKFLSAYRDKTEIRWQETKNWLNSYLSTDADIADAIEAARRMFQIYGDQLSRRI